MNFKTIRFEKANKRATITLDQPEKRNALSDELLTELTAAFGAARADKDIRVVVLRSSDDRIFSAGGDLTGFTNERPLVEKYRSIELFPNLFRLIGQLGKPTICAANGHVLAGSLGLALACDLIIAKDNVRFGVPEINVGVFPFMVMALLFRNVPRKKATELLLLGDQISALEAERLGFVNRVVSGDDFEATVDDYAERLAAKSPLLTELGKNAMYQQLDMSLDQAFDFLRSQLALAFSTSDIEEGVQAFLDKRKPVWTGN